MDFNDDQKADKKSKKKLTNFFDEDRNGSEDSNEGVLNDDDDDDDSDIDMEITWQPGLKSKTEQKSTTSNGSVNEKKENKKKKGEKSNRKAETEHDDNEEEANSRDNDQATLELLDIDDDVDGKRDFNLRDMIKSHKQVTKAAAKSAKKGKKLSQQSSSSAVEENNDNDAFHLNVNDKRFHAVYTQPAFNIDQSDPHFKSTAGTQRLIDEKLKKRKLDHLHSSSRTDRDEDDIVVKLKRKSAKKE